MKKLIYFFALCTTGLSAQAQYYSFFSSVQTYSDISEADITDTVMNEYVPFLPEQPFKMFGKSGMTSYSAGVTAGYMVASNAQYGVALDPMMGTRLRKISGQSSISIKEMYSLTDTLLVVQWKQIGLMGHPDSEFLNFQLRINLRTEQVEFHYGPSNYVRTANDSAFTNPLHTGPEVLVVLLYPDFTGYYEFTSVSGNPSNPVYSKNYARMTDIPTPNQLFTFKKSSPVGFNEDTWNNRSHFIYPNPAVNRSVSVALPETIKRIKLYSSVGKLIMEQIGGESFNLPSGCQLFFAEITLTSGEKYIEKIVTP